MLGVTSPSSKNIRRYTTQLSVLINENPAGQKLSLRSICFNVKLSLRSICF